MNTWRCFCDYGRLFVRHSRQHPREFFRLPCSRDPYGALCHEHFSADWYPTTFRGQGTHLTRVEFYAPTVYSRIKRLQTCKVPLIGHECLTLFLRLWALVYPPFEAASARVVPPPYFARSLWRSLPWTFQCRPVPNHLYLSRQDWSLEGLYFPAWARVRLGSRHPSFTRAELYAPTSWANQVTAREIDWPCSAQFDVFGCDFRTRCSIMHQPTNWRPAFSIVVFVREIWTK